MAAERLRALTDKVCFRLSQLLRKLQKRRSWNGPSCTCKAFRDRGKCKHLELFQEANLKAGVDLGAAGSATARRKRFRRDSGRNPDSEAPEASSSSVSTAATRRSSQNYVLATSKYALSNARGHNMGDVIVPNSIKQLTSEVQLLDNIGRGGCGRLLFRSASNEHGVVLTKVLRCEPPACLPHHQAAMNNELEVLAKLRPHPNLVAFFGYTEMLLDGDVLERRVAFEFAVDTLSDLVHHRSTAQLRLTYLEIRNYCIDVSCAVDYLHSVGVVHRDVSSENVLMSINQYPSSGQWTEVMKRHFRLSNSIKSLFGANQPPTSSSHLPALHNTPRSPPPSKKPSKSIGWRSKPQHHAHYPAQQIAASLNPDSPMGPTMTAKLGNFEVAKEIHSQRTRTRVSSPSCMPPEMWCAHDYDYAVDVWAIGSLLFEMLAKEKPFAKLNLSQIDALVSSRNFPPRAPVAPVEFRALEKIMRSCLAFEPAHRPTVSELLNDLRLCLM